MGVVWLRKHKVLAGRWCFEFPSWSRHRGYFSWMILDFARKYRAYHAVIKDVTEVAALLSVFMISVLKTASPKFQHAGQNNSNPSFLVSSVPSVYPRNVTVHLNESWLVISWKPPPDDKINGILRGYDVIVRHGTQENKVSSVATQCLSRTSSSFCSDWWWLKWTAVSRSLKWKMSKVHFSLYTWCKTAVEQVSWVVSFWTVYVY